MATFNQSGQIVRTQYNADTISFAEVQTVNDLLPHLKQLQTELIKAISEKSLPDEKAIDADSQMKKAILEAEKPDPNKKTLIKHLSVTKELVSNVTGIAVAISGAIAAVGRLF